MKPNQKLSYAICSILGLQGASAAVAATASGDSSEALGEIIVTAQRREENIQNVPITIQALTSETISQLNVVNLDDIIKFLPNVTQATNGPAQGDIIMRGLSVGANGGNGGGTTGAFPAVAIYLDEQSDQLPGRNLDVYAADLERIEVLEGPQGTLFGGGALSGVLRYITNKPKLDVTEGSVDAGYSTTAHGDPNTNVTAVLNLPLIDDTLAVRAVIYNDRHGGYINNVPSTFSRSSTDLGIARYNGGVVPTNSVSINNNSIVANAINPLTYTGFRLGARYKINNDWDALLTQSYQNMDSQGVFYEMPYGAEGASLTANGTPTGGQPLPPLSVTLFNPSYNKDKFENTALVVNGKISDLKLVYSGSYLVRNVDQLQDYTNYARGVNASYYQCVGLSANPATGQCYTPSTTWTEQTRNTHQSQELRLSTPDDKRIRGLVGVYWEKYNIVDQTHWRYVTVPNCSPTGLNADCYLPLQPWAGSPPYTPNPPSGFFDDVERGYKQLAEFASLEFDVIPHALTVTGGIRHFKYDDKESGGDVGSFYCKVGGAYGPAAPTTYFGPCQAPYGTNVSTRAPNRTTPSGNRARGNLSWHVTDHDLLYYTWSQSFRAGQFNRGTSCHLPGPDGVDQFCVPAFTVPDNVTNNEVGWKTEWFDQRVQFNGAVYQEVWSNAQTGFFDPQGGLGNLAFATNGPSYRVRGVEPSVIARVTHGLTVQASAAWNSPSQTNSPYLVDNNPASVNFGKNITSILNPYGPLGSPTAYSPPFNVNVRLRYEWDFNDYNAFVQVAGQHQGHMITATGYVPAYDMPGYSSYDASAGIARGAWSMQIFGQNLSNVNSSQSTDSGQFILTEVPQRPRVLGVKFAYKFSGK
ncbi:MAG TPA: TonB-dependent receptor [Steroidobacteraceae bacterium]|nr:TonB-dependent receptor [Steroidobacteraceae bacterium]